VFWGSIWVTIKLNLVINPLQITLALGLALLANQRFPGIDFYRLLFFVPIGVSVPIASILWKTMFDPNANILFFFIVLTFLVPFEAIAIPLYTVVRSIGWLDTYQGLIGPGVANGIVIFLFRQFFAQIPRELAESARLEGASWVTILFRIYLPLSKPVVISAALLIFLFQWESFLWPLIATRSENLKVIQVALAGFEEWYVTLWNELFAAAIVAALIPLIILLPLQRFYVQGVTAAATKD
jgi:multiple sugar transport system permease protein